MRFDAPMLDMEPVLPHTPQGDCREVTVFNEGTWDVEIFSLDFDKVRLNAGTTQPILFAIFSLVWHGRGLCPPLAPKKRIHVHQPLTRQVDVR